MMPIGTTNPMATAGVSGAAPQNPSALVLCGARTRQGGACRHVAMRNGRCRFHGGLSTGPRTIEGRKRSCTSMLSHGGRSREMAEFRRSMRVLRAAAKCTIELA